jgi:serralysin
VREILDGDVANSATDVAVFGDVRANYTINMNADGSITVNHVVQSAGVASDGSDTVRNIELLQFAGGETVSTVNTPATGEVLIVGEAIEGGFLFADTSSITDANGALAFSFQWFSNGVAIAGATGESYEPVDADKGLTLTVEVVAEDELGFTTTFLSAPTAAVINVDVGTAGNDLMNGTVLADQLFGLGGNDTLNGSDGNDSLFGGTGNDWINGQLGNDVMDGDTGNDTFVVNSLGDVVLEAAGGGTDTVQAWVNGYTLADNVENLLLVLPSGLNGNGNALANTITGNTQDNVIDGGLGNDTMIGGSGNDTYYANSTADVVTEALNSGTDSVISSASYTLSANVENLTLTGVAGLSGTGNGLANVVTGNDGANLLSGVAGNDTLIGGGGNDTLSGGVGQDVLTGGTGNDLFDFDTAAQAGNGAAARDVITDFVQGQDRIDLSGIDANTAGLLGFLFNEAFSATVVQVGGPGAAFSANGQLHYYFDGGNTIIEGNVNGNNATAEFQIQVAGNHAFTAGDFIL